MNDRRREYRQAVGHEVRAACQIGAQTQETALADLPPIELAVLAQHGFDLERPRPVQPLYHGAERGSRRVSHWCRSLHMQA